MNSIILTFGDRVKFVRKLWGFSQEELAQKLGLRGNSTVVKYEKNIAWPEQERLKAIAEIGMVSLGWLVSGEVTKNICQAIDSICRREHLRISEFSEMLSVPREYLRAIGEFKISPSDAFLLRVAGTFNINLHDLERSQFPLQGPLKSTGSGATDYAITEFEDILELFVADRDGYELCLKLMSSRKANRESKSDGK